MASVLSRIWHRLRAARAISDRIGGLNYVVFDTELTGLDRKRDDIIAIGAIRMSGTRVMLGETFYTLVKPQRELPHANIRLHRLLPSELADKPTIDAALTCFLEFVGDDILVGHFLQIDTAFVNRELKAHGLPALKNPRVDTMRVHDWLERNRREFLGANGAGAAETNLFALAQSFGIPVHDAHNALYDAYLTAQVWQRLMADLPDFGLRRLKDLARFG